MSTAGGSAAPEIVVVADREALAVEGARRVAAAIRGTPGAFALALSGGSTPRDLYRRLAAEDVPWERVQLFWGDERCVPPDHPDSNYRMAREALLDRIRIPPGNVHRWPAERPPAEAAALYAGEVAALPRLDLALQGLGAEGHTASLFPDSPALEAVDGAVAVHVPKLSAWRLTLTPRVLSAARAALFLVAGPDKAAAVRDVLAGPLDPRRLPAQAVRSERVTWLLDREAASGLPAGLTPSSQSS